MGSWRATVTPQSYECSLEEVVNETFSFDLVLSRDEGSGEGWLTLNGYTRDGGFDGQNFVSTADAARIFVACQGCRTRMTETFRFQVYSGSQWSAAGQVCRDEVPAPNETEGIVAPGRTEQGFDAAQLCGSLEMSVNSTGTADGGACDAACDSCRVSYRLQATRR